MANPLSLPQPDLRPSGVIGGGAVAPNPLDDFLSAFLQSQQLGLEKRRQSSNESQAAREFELEKARFGLEKEKLQIQQAAIAHQTEMTKQQGGAVQQFLKGISPLIEQQAQYTPPGQLPPALQMLTGQQGPQQAPAMPVSQESAPVPQTVAQPSASPTWSDLVSKMDPEAAAQFAHEQLPQLLALQKSLNPTQEGQAVQTGDTVTTFVPGKGFWDAKLGKFVPSIERGMSQDEKTIKMLQIQESRERIAAMQAYREATQAQGMTRQFNGRTKDLQQRGAIINQALQTISDAQNNPDPNQRRILYSSAIANFVQAADQKAQLRYQMLQYFKNNIDPSIGGRWDVLRTRMLQGTLPAYATQGMLHHLNNLLTLTGNEYDKQRQAEVRRHPELANWLPEKDEFFNPMTIGGATDQSGGLLPPP